MQREDICRDGGASSRSALPQQARRVDFCSGVSESRKLQVGAETFGGAVEAAGGSRVAGEGSGGCRLDASLLARVSQRQALARKTKHRQGSLGKKLQLRFSALRRQNHHSQRPSTSIQPRPTASQSQSPNSNLTSPIPESLRLRLSLTIQSPTAQLVAGQTQLHITPQCLHEGPSTSLTN